MNQTKSHLTKGFSLVEVLVVIAVIGVIASAGFFVATSFVGSSKLSNEYTHLIQLVKKYYKLSNAQSEPMFMKFVADDTNFYTETSVTKFLDDNYSRFGNPDCDLLQELDSASNEDATNPNQKNDYIFDGMRVLVCGEGSNDLTYSGICYTGRNELAETVVLYIHSMSDSAQTCASILTLKDDFVRKLTLYSTGDDEDERNF